jgi:hypothetical protein
MCALPSGRDGRSQAGGQADLQHSAALGSIQALQLPLIQACQHIHLHPTCPVSCCCNMQADQPSMLQARRLVAQMHDSRRILRCVDRQHQEGNAPAQSIETWLMQSAACLECKPSPDLIHAG